MHVVVMKVAPARGEALAEAGDVVVRHGHPVAVVGDAVIFPAVVQALARHPDDRAVDDLQAVVAVPLVDAEPVPGDDPGVLDRDIVGVDVKRTGNVQPVDHRAVGLDLGGVGTALPGGPGRGDVLQALHPGRLPARGLRGREAARGVGGMRGWAVGRLGRRGAPGSGCGAGRRRRAARRSGLGGLGRRRADVPCETGLSVPCADGVPLEQPAAASAASATMPRSMLPVHRPRRPAGAAGRRDVVDSAIRFPPWDWSAGWCQAGIRSGPGSALSSGLDTRRRSPGTGTAAR